MESKQESSVVEVDKLAQTLASEELTGRQTDEVVRAL
jgi:hypothetical protein